MRSSALNDYFSHTNNMAHTSASENEPLARLSTHTSIADYPIASIVFVAYPMLSL